MLPAVRFYTYSKRFEEAYTAAMRPLTEELDMAQPAVDILLFLANNPGMDTARDICTYRHLKPAIVSFHVEKLAGEGYLERQPVPGDRRKCRLVCTEKAGPVLQRGRAVQETFSRQLTEGLTEEELEEKYQEMAALYGMTVPQLREQVPPARLQHDLKLAKARAVVVDSALRK